MKTNLLKLAAVAACSMMAFPLFAQETGSIRIGAHRGFWDCDETSRAENSVAALKKAQETNLWGSEFDIHITADNEILVHHDRNVQELDIQKTNLVELRKLTLANGEPIPTLDEYLSQAERCASTVLVLEFKSQYSAERENLMVDITFKKLREHGLYDPSRVMFISFSKNVCLKVAKEAPEFTNQYLSGDIAPEELHKMGINGIDYQYKVLSSHPEWVKQAHDLGMSVNAWTVNKEKDIKAMIDLGVDCITTNAPLLVRELLGDKELRIAPCGDSPKCCCGGGCCK